MRIKAFLTNCTRFHSFSQDAQERPTFEALVYRLEDFFHSDMQYTEASKVMGDDEDDDKEKSLDASKAEDKK